MTILKTERVGRLGDERIVELQATFSMEKIREKALAKRIDAFGQVAKLFQRPKAGDIEIRTIQNRLDPFSDAEA